MHTRREALKRGLGLLSAGLVVPFISKPLRAAETWWSRTIPASFNKSATKDSYLSKALINEVTEKIKIALQPLVFEPNDSFTRNACKTRISNVLNSYKLDHSVKCDYENNKPSDIDRNQLNATITFPAKINYNLDICLLGVYNEY